MTPLADNMIHLIPLDKIKVQKYNVRRHDIDLGTEDLAINIKANGLLQPIAAFLDSEKDVYVILTGQRRLNAYHYLNDKYPGKGFDKIKCILIDEPETDQKKMSLSLAENITQLPMTNSDLVRSVTDLFNTYHDYDMVREEFGLSKYMIDKYVRLARLPDRLKAAVNDGEISPNPKISENAALAAVDALQYTKGGDRSADEVLLMAKALAKGETNRQDARNEANRGGTVQEIIDRVGKRPKSKLSLELSLDVAEKLREVAKNSGESERVKAASYVNAGVVKDYSELNN